MKRPVSTLDAGTAPLTGVNLIEANAGTGKTYNIASLYTRLIATSDLTVDRILVVSFTEAATAELQERIRGRLVSLQQALASGQSEHAHEAALVEQAATDSERCRRRVQRALQSFDEAAINTIHGFCQRLLAESAFEAGFGFDFELAPDDSALRRQIVDDFWRANTAAGSRLWLEWLYDATSPGKLTRQLGRYFSRPLVRRVQPPRPDPATIAALETQFSARLARVRAAWPDAREEVRALLGVKATMHQSIYKPQLLDELLHQADAMCAGQISPMPALKSGSLGKLGRDTVLAKTKKNQTPPQHELFDRFQDLLDDAQALSDAYEDRLGALRAELIAFAESELRSRKRALRVRHFDDLLNDVHEALQGTQAQVLCDAARERYGAALIDEFQDTDPVQFAIFDRLFCENGLPVFFVGDPKQAIYSFRNADVYAYLAAREESDRFYRLDENFRSTPELVEAVNALFERPAHPFLLEAIAYRRSRAHFDSMLLRGACAVPMQWWVIDADAGGARQKTGNARRDVAQVTAGEIVRMLGAARAGRLTRPDGRGGQVPLHSRDIAVLVRTHNEGDLVRRALAERGVACVQRSDRSVFQTHEAAELSVVLNGIAHYTVQPAVRAALATELLGFDAHALDALASDDVQWQRRLDAMAQLRATWVRRGFAPMHRQLLREFEIEPRLLALQDGQRRLTNLLHLEDLLQRESSYSRRMPDELLAWLQSQCDSDAPPGETSLLRLESDEDLVQIQTIHFSKGLQYPVVFCPFLWGGQQHGPESPAVFHHDNDACLDLGSHDLQHHQEIARDEAFAESLRLAYVALTRAELACIAVWGSVQAVHSSAPAWLLHSEAGDDRKSLQARVKGLPHDRLVAPLRELGGDTVAVTALPEVTTDRLESPAPPSTLQARVLTAPVPGARRVSSFSALARSHTEQPRDYDALAGMRAAEAAQPVTGIAGFPRGARAGRCIHSLFEHIAFDAAPGDIAPVAASALEQNGFSADLAPVLTRMAGDVVRTPLFADGKATLADIGAGRRVDEMEFYFPTDGLSAADLRGALGGFGAGNDIASRLAALEFTVAAGHFHGFIDLVAEIDGRFYLFDYKSNWLGNEAQAYVGDALVAEIARHDYYLQYLIYSVALHRHLRLSLDSYDYERHFGGVLYLFVRGMQPQTGPGFGIFRDRPAPQVIAALEKVLCTGGAE